MYLGSVVGLGPGVSIETSQPGCVFLWGGAGEGTQVGWI